MFKIKRWFPSFLIGSSINKQDSVGGVLGLFAKDKEMWPRVEKSKLCLHFLSQFVSQVSFIGNNVNLA